MQNRNRMRYSLRSRQLPFEAISKAETNDQASHSFDNKEKEDYLNRGLLKKNIPSIKPMKKRKLIPLTNTKEETSKNIKHYQRKKIKFCITDSNKQLVSHLLTYMNTDSLKQVTIENKEIFKNYFLLSIVPGPLFFKNISLTDFIRGTLQTHGKYLNFLCQDRSAEHTTEFGPYFDYLESKLDKKEWKREFQSSLLFHEPLSQCIPFISNVGDAMNFCSTVLSKFVASREDICETFFKELYLKPSNGKGLNTLQLIVKAVLYTVKLWDMNHEKYEFKKQRSILFESAVKLLSKIVTYELCQLSKTQLDVERDDSFLFSFETNEIIAVHRLFHICYSYFNSSSEKRRISAPFVEMVHFFVSSATGGRSNGSNLEIIWKREGPVIFEDIFSEDVLDLLVHSPLQRCFGTGSKIYLEKNYISFIYAVICQLELSGRNLYHHRITNMFSEVVMKLLKELSENQMSVFLDLWECRKSSSKNNNCVDLIAKLLSKETFLREIFGSVDGHRTKFLDILQNLLNSASKFQLQEIDLSSVHKWYKDGPFCQTPTTLGEASEMAKILFSASERQAVLHAYSSLARILGTLVISFGDGSRNVSQLNPINIFLHEKANSSRNALSFLEKVLTIQIHLEKSLKVPIMNPKNMDRSERSTTTTQSDSVQKIEILMLSNEERGSFSQTLEAIRSHVCKLKNVSICKLGLDGLENDTDKNCVPNSQIPGPAFSKVFHYESLNDPLVSNEKHKDLEDDALFMYSVAKYGIRDGREVISRFDESDDSVAIPWTSLMENEYLNGSERYLREEEKIPSEFCSCVPVEINDCNGNCAMAGCVDDKCDNRCAKIECGPGHCGAGAFCMNRRLQNSEYAKTKTDVMEGKGIGLVAVENIDTGMLIGEYQGEVLSTTEYEQRKKEYFGERHFYFMNLTNKLVIDASRKSKTTRFINHSCDPNCVAEKWIAGGYPRIAIIANRPIHSGEEITYDYGAISIDDYSTPCLCGSSKCRGFLTAPKDSNEKRKPGRDSLLNTEKNVREQEKSKCYLSNRKLERQKKG